jgi:alpha-glucosidase
MTSHARAEAEQADRLWWQHGVIYQIYPRSFMDANGDGVGDLEGIRQRLDHLAWLGVDGIWLSPTFPSPMADFGYDVADYCGVDPVFGSLEDMDRLIAEAHAKGLRVILDWVPNHSSDQHPWFQESRASRQSPKRDWYVWRDPKPDGSPPNNWLSVFGGPAWEWDEATGQFYLHTYLKEQPELDWRNPEVERAMHDVLRFWLDRGVDGFRIDVVHGMAKDPELRDNPVIHPDRGYGGQQHVHSNNHPDVHPMLRRVRELMDGYDERMMVGEVYLMDPVEVARYYGRGDELHLAFNFSFLRAPWSCQALRSEIERWEALVPEQGWPDWTLSNHDHPRHATRYDPSELGESRARLAAMLLLTLRGTPFLYYGEEIGMRNVPVPHDRLQDPIAHTLHPNASRDPERTPMQWSAGAGAGFSTAEPWLPIASDADVRNVEAQRKQRESLLWLYRDLIDLRRRTPALERGSWRLLDAPPDVLAFERSHGESRVRVALNLADEARTLDLGHEPVLESLRSERGRREPDVSSRLELGPAEGVVLVLD